MKKVLSISISQCKELVALGIDMSKASMFWEYKGTQNGKSYYNLNVFDFDSIPDEDIPTFTLQDMLELLPDSIVDKDGYTRIQMILPQDNKEVIIA